MGWSKIQRVIVLFVMLSIMLAGCSENDNSTNKKLEAVQEIAAQDICVVSFAYYDEERNYHEYWLDFESNTIECGDNEYEIDAEKMEELRDYIRDYNEIIFSGIYWPQTDEYPEMEMLFDYFILVNDDDVDPDSCTEYAIDGCRDYGYPKDWDNLVEKVNELFNNREYGI